MKKTVRSPGSATIINAIATGFGSAFGIGLDIKCEAKTIPKGIDCINDVGADTKLMDLCVERVFNHYDISNDEYVKSHATWYKFLIEKYDDINKDNVDNILKYEVGIKFSQVLTHAGVFKRDLIGILAFDKFINSL